MVYPNNRYMLCSPGRHFGPGGIGLSVFARNRTDDNNRFVSDTYAKTSSTPDGYGLTGWSPAMKAGSMGAMVFVDVEAAGSLVQGGLISGTADVTITAADGSMSLTSSLTGTSDITLTGNDSNLAGVIQLAASATVTLSGDNSNLGMTVPFEGTSSFAFQGDANLKGLLSLEGHISPFAELSPEGLARAVWDYQVRVGDTASELLTGAYDNAGGGGGGGGLTVGQANQLNEIHAATATTATAVTDISKIHGLVSGSPLTVTATSRSAGGVTQTISENSGTVTVTRT